MNKFIIAIGIILVLFSLVFFSCAIKGDETSPPTLITPPKYCVTLIYSTPLWYGLSLRYVILIAGIIVTAVGVKI